MTRVKPISVLATVAILAAARSWDAHAQSAAVVRKGITPFDTAVELASFDTAWRRVRDLYYDSTMHGLDWNHVRDQYRPLVAAAHSRDEVRSAISKMFAALGDSHFGVIPNEQMSSTEGA